MDEIHKTDVPIQLNDRISSTFLNDVCALFGMDSEEFQSKDDLIERIDNVLSEEIHRGNTDAYFQLGQIYYEAGQPEKARKYFENGSKTNPQCLYQLAVLHFDGLISNADKRKAVELMVKVARNQDKSNQHLVHCAEFNIGRAYFQGEGVDRQSDDEAERWWLRAADDGNPNGSVLAQSMLGLFYSRPDTLDLRKAFFWHNEACGNGSLESQGALGAMYLKGVGASEDIDSAFECFREAAERGNVYAMSQLVSIYYRRHMWNKVSALTRADIDRIAHETKTLPSYIAKGVATACFYYARCLQDGKGVKQEPGLAREFFSKVLQ